MRQGTVPNHQIAGFPFDRNCIGLVFAHHLPRIRIRRQFFQPRLQFLMETGDTGKRALVAGGIGEVKHALHFQAHRHIVQRHIPMQIGPGELPLWTFRWVHACPVETYPEFIGAPDFRERLMHARILTVIPQCLMLVNLHHDALPRRLGIPTFRIVAFHLKEVPNGLFSGSAILNGNRFRNNDVAVFFPKFKCFCVKD